MTHKVRISIVIGVLVLFALLMFFEMQHMKRAGMRENQMNEYPKISTDIWGITLADVDGNIVPLTNFIGVPVVIQSWSTSCLFCTQEMPNLVSYAKEFSRSVQFVAINRSESKDHVLSFVDTHDPDHALHHLLDSGDLFYSSVGAVTEPETLFISADGELVFQAQGPVSDQEMRDMITKMLE